MEMDRLSEHEAPNEQQSTTTSDQVEQSHEDKEAVKLVEKCFQKAKKYREKYDHKWSDYYKMFRGKQYKEDVPSYRNQAVFNLIFRTIQSQVPILTDSRPKIEFLPQEPSDRELAEILNQVAESDWEKNNWLMTIVECLYDANIYNIGYGNVDFDKSKNDGLGDIVFESFDPFYAFPCPYAPDINHRKSRFFVTAVPTPIEELKAEYPDKAQYIKPDLNDFNDGDKDDIYKSQYQSPTDRYVLSGSRDYSSIDDNDRALKITLYIFDSETEETEVKGYDEEGNETLEVEEKLKYPKGRKICIVGKTLLHDGPMEFEDGKIPFAKMVNYMLPREFFGVGEVENLEQPQNYYNKVFSFVLDVLELTGNPVWIVDRGSGIDTDNIYNRPGLILEPNPGTRVERKEGTQLQPYVLNVLEKIGSVIDDIGGNNDVSRGINPTGVTAAKAIEALQDSAQTRLRQKSRFLDGFLQQIGQMYLSRVMQFRSQPQVYRLTNSEGVQNYFKFHVETQQDENGNEVKVANYRPIYLDGEDGQPQLSDEQKYQTLGKFDVKVGTGSSLPFAVAEKEQRAYALFDRQIIDDEEVLKTVDWPNKESVLERMAQKKQAAAEAQAAQQGAGQPA